jgi:hypothetical protein
MISSLRAFNEAGSQAYEALFALENKSEIPELARKLADDPSLTHVIYQEINLPVPATRLALARAIESYLGSGSSNEEQSRNPEFWNWLSARLMIEVLTDPTKVGDKKRWFYTPGPRTEYRHIFASGFLTFSMFRNDVNSVMGLLCQDLGGWSELLEQVLATRALAGSVGLQLASAIYFDPSTGTNKPGHGSKGPGSARRLVAFLNQIRLTVDIKSMTVPELLKLLPPEFNKFTKP